MMRITARRRLLIGSALGAALAVPPATAAAEGLQGAPNVSHGAPIIETTPTGTQVTINDTETIIDWTPFDVGTTGTIDFLPAGNSVSFSDSAGAQNFTVLNRILPVDGSSNPVARPIALNGIVESTSAGSPGGNVWFYSPTGIVVGPTARFNVGGLVLTTDDISVTPTNTGGTWLYAPGNTVLFREATASASFVEIQEGAQIAASASQFGAGYVALVAPRIVQGGQVSADGSIAYVAAEQLDLTIDAGSFEIAIVAGTTDENGIVHTGTTTGPASAGPLDAQRISMVALPKNTALTMLLSGSVGYDPAVSVFDDGSSIVLAAGYDSGEPASLPGNTLGGIAIDAATFGNPVTGYASNDIAVSAATGATGFARSAEFYALDSIAVAATGGNILSGAESLSFAAGAPGSGGTIDVTADTGGAIDVTDFLSFDATDLSHPYYFSTPYFAAQGGEVTVAADGGTIAAGSMSASADAFAPAGSVTGGDGVGGTIGISVANKGTISAESLDLFARGGGGGATETGGDGTGGAIALADLGGALDLDFVSADASGYGGDADVGEAGDGFSGEVAIDIAGQAQDWSSLDLSANARSGTFASPGTSLSGNATGSTDAVRLSVAGPGALSVAEDFSISADAITLTDGVTGFTGQAGGVVVEAVDGGALTVGDVLQVEASARLFGDFDPTGAASAPTQQGGAISILADGGGSISAPFLEIRAEARGVAAGKVPGDATGGSAEVMASNGGTITLTDALERSIISANGYGSPGSLASNAFGGSALLVAEDGAIAAAHEIEVTASGLVREFGSFVPPPPGDGFAATGGTAAVEIRAGTAGTGTIEATDLSVLANGDGRMVFLEEPPPPGGLTFQGDGGDGTGGSASASVAAGTLTTGRLLVEATGTGGASAATSALVALQSGDGAGGTSQFTQAGGATTVANLDVLAEGVGGGSAVPAAEGATAALAGAGTGGTAGVALSGGALQTTAGTRISATGTGADGMDHGAGDASSGGAGQGGQALLSATAGSTASFASPLLSLSADGVGGAGGVAVGGANGDGGEGTALSARIALADGAFALGAVTVTASGAGGDGATGGAGSGGEAGFAVVDATGPSGARTLTDLTLEANGTAGVSGSGAPAQANAGSLELVAQVFDAGSSLTIGGDAVFHSLGSVAAPASGLTGTVAGGALNIGGALTAEVTGDIAISAAQPLLAAGDATFTAGRSFASTGLVGTAGVLAIQAPTGIGAERLSSGGTTLLAAPLGALSVSTDLASAGPVTALARFIDIVSLGALTFADLDATAGPLSVTTAGDLAVATADATGAVSLVSTGGAIAATGAVNAGGNVIANGAAGVTLPTLNSGGTTQLASADGPVAIDTLVSPGAISVSANSVDIAGPGPLTFTTAEADTTMTVASPGNLAFGSITAGGALSLTSGGALAVAGDSAAGDATIVAPDGIALAGFASTGTVALTAADGAISATDLTAAGDVAALAQSIDIASSGALTFADLDATAGALSVATAGDLDLATADAADAVSLVSTGGAITATGAVNAGGNVIADGAAGVVLPTLNSGGTTQLASAGGPVDIDALVSPGAISVSANSVDIAGPGPLTFATAEAGTTMTVATPGDLAFSSITAGGALSLTSGGALAVTGDAAAGGATIVAPGGIELAGFASTGPVDLTATDGAISADDLTATGAVTALARSIAIASSGALTFADLDATAGPLSVTAAGDLGLATADATGALALRSTGGDLTASGDIAGDGVLLAAAGDIAVGGGLTGAPLTVNSGGAFTVAGDVTTGDAAIAADGGIELAGLDSTGTVDLTAAGGAISVAELTATGAVTASGQSVDIVSSGALTFADLDATAGPLSVTALGDLALATADATGALALRSTGGDLIASGDIAGGSVLLAAAGDIVPGGDIAAEEQLAVQAGGGFALTGTASGAAISVRSSDIALGDASALGVRGTTATIDLLSGDPSAPTFVGGVGGAGDGYAIDQAEAGRLFADDSIAIGVDVDLPAPAGQGAVVIDDLSLSFGADGNIGEGGLLEISTPGEVSIVGDIALTTASAGDRFLIDPTRVELDTGAGSIAMLGTDGNPLGRLSMVGDLIAIADADTLGLLRTETDFAAIVAALDTPGAAAEPVRAGAIAFDVSEGLYIQNGGASDAYADRRGFAAGSVEIDTAGPSSRFAINGRILGAAGPVDGLDTASLVLVNGAPATTGGSFDPASTINGCAVGTSCGFVPPEPPAATPPTSEDLERPVEDGEPAGSQFDAPLIELADTEPLITPPLVDEPITGVGNDDLWVSPCEPGGESCEGADAEP